MEVTAKLLPFPWLLAGWGLLIAVLAAATVTAPWRRLQDAEMQHALFGGIVALAVLLAGVFTGHGDLGGLGLNALLLFVLPALPAHDVAVRGLHQRRGHRRAGGHPARVGLDLRRPPLPAELSADP